MGKKTQKQKRNRTRHDFLLTLFPDNPELFYMTKEINGFYLVRQYNKGNNEWDVAIYTSESFNKRQSYLDKVNVSQVTDEGDKLPF